jgi:DNA-binding MarR family transcriptional regulator
MPYRLSYSANLVSEAIAQQYGVIFNLTIPEWRVVAHVAEESGITQQEIGLRTRMDKVTVSRAAIALAARGLVSRGNNPADRRSRLLSLTPAGRRLYAAIAPKALELERAVFGQFSAAELAVFGKFLQRIDTAAAAAMIAESDAAASS